jgi:tyrosyl-tRNA synthetase
VHRDIQREYGQASEVALTMPILVGLDGERKMSKSLGNYVGITEAPGEMFGKLMSISDELMWSYYELLTDFASPVIVGLQEEVRTGALHPKKAKMELAHNIVQGFHGEEAARKAGEEFERVFSGRETPSEVPVKRLAHSVPTRVSTLLFISDLAPSRSEAERLIKQGGVEVDGQRVADVKHELDLSKPGEFLLRAGKKRFLRIVVE